MILFEAHANGVLGFPFEGDAPGAVHVDGVAHAILAEKSSITPEMALRLGKLCGNGPGLWLRMQQSCDLWRAERDLAEEVKKIPTMRAA